MSQIEQNDWPAQVFSFKIRGAYNCIAHLSQERKDKGIVACSAGNHAQVCGRRRGVRPRVHTAQCDVFGKAGIGFRLLVVLILICDQVRGGLPALSPVFRCCVKEPPILHRRPG